MVYGHPRRQAIIAVVLGATVAILILVVPLASVSPTIALLRTQPGGGPPAPNRSVSTVAPSGTSWNLTPPSTWCTYSNPPGGAEYTCSMAGAAWISLDVLRPSRLSGTVSVNGSFAVWIVPSVWSCELGAELSGFHWSCPIPVDPPPWHEWNGTFSATNALDLSSLPLNITNETGVLPPAPWTMFLVDAQSANETATAVSPVMLSAV